jgi:hypothetical protein
VPALRRLVLAGREEREQVEQPERAAHDAVEPGLADAELLAHRGGLLVVELGQLGLQAAGHGDGEGTVPLSTGGAGGRFAVATISSIGVPSIVIAPGWTSRFSR